MRPSFGTAISMPPPILARSPFRFSPVSGRAHWGLVHERPNRVSTNFRVPSASSARSADKRVCSAVYLEAGVTISTIAHSIRHPRQQRPGRTEESRGGKEWGRKVSIRGAADRYKKKQRQKKTE